MNCSQAILGNDLEKLTFQDIQQYFQNPRSESTIAEYKSFNPNGPLEDKFKGIYKTICAFLNSQGGVLVWGAPVGKKVENNKKEKEFRGSLTSVTSDIEKDYLINKISSNIIPIPNGINAKIIEQDDSRVIVIEVQKSDYAPHQTENTYYMRLDGQTVPAPHHYIDALFKQIKYPNLNGFLKLNKVIGYNDNYILLGEVLIVNLSPYQNEESVFVNVLCPNGEFVNDKFGEGTNLNDYGHSLHIEKFINILHCGATPMLDFKVKYNRKDIIESNGKSVITLSFGGKSSPMKVSTYHFNIGTNYGAGKVDIIEMEENKVFYDLRNSYFSPEEAINKLLQRE